MKIEKICIKDMLINKPIGFRLQHSGQANTHVLHHIQISQSELEFSPAHA